MRAMHQIRQAWPDGHLTLVCGPGNLDLARALGIFDRIVPYRFSSDTPPYPSPAEASEQYSRFAARELGARFDLAIDLRYDADTRPCLDPIDARFRAGYAARNLKATLDLELPTTASGADRSLPPPLAVHAELRLALLACAVVETFGAPTHPIQSMALTPALDNEFASRRYIVVAAGARKTVCKWPIANFVAVCAALAARRSHDIVVIGTQDDRADSHAIAQAVPTDRVRDTTGQVPIDKLPALLANASLYIGNDTGPTHIAAKLGVPTICIFSGANDHRVWQPLGANVRIIRTDIGCSPCHLLHEDGCPVGVKCLQLITVDDVLNAALAMLDETGLERPAIAGN